MDQVSAIQAENLSKEFVIKKWFTLKKIVLAIRGLNFNILQGETVAFLGPNGAGKSTSIKLLCGILKPTKGKSWILGQPSGSIAANRQLGLVFGTKSHLWMLMTIRQSLELLSEIYRVPNKDKHKRIGFLCELFEAESLLERKASSLSLGERMRCEIIASLLHRPAVLLADEPTIGLDITAKSRLRSLLHRWRLEENGTLLLTSHDCSDVEALCERAIFIKNGQIHYDGSLHSLKTGYNSTRYIKLTLSAPVDHKDNVNNMEPFLVEDTLLMKKFCINLETVGVSEMIRQLSNIYKEAVIDISIEPINLETAIFPLFEKAP